MNDLYAFAMPRLNEIQRPANVHFTPEGSRQLGEEVARAIRDALKATTDGQATGEQPAVGASN